MTGSELRAALDALGWSQAEAARALQVSSRQRINHWITERLEVPPYIAASVRAHLEVRRLRAKLAQVDPTPS